MSFLNNKEVHPLPNPSGLQYSLVQLPDLTIQGKASDTNAFLLSETTYKLNFQALKEMDIPSELEHSFLRAKADYLTLFALEETQNVLAVFQNTIQRDRFTKVFKKNYICHTELDLRGIVVI